MLSSVYAAIVGQSSRPLPHLGSRMSVRILLLLLLLRFARCETDNDDNNSKTQLEQAAYRPFERKIFSASFHLPKCFTALMKSRSWKDLSRLHFLIILQYLFGIHYFIKVIKKGFQFFLMNTVCFWPHWESIMGWLRIINYFMSANFSWAKQVFPLWPNRLSVFFLFANNISFDSTKIS